MLLDTRHLQRLLVIQLGNLKDLEMTKPALQILRQALPSTAITLLASPSNNQLVHLPGVDEVLEYEASGFTSSNASAELTLIETLSNRAFDAAVIFTNPGESPYPLAYICYLAGIPVRLGQSQEFGGSVLSSWIDSKSDHISVAQHLLLSAGLSTWKAECPTT